MIGRLFEFVDFRKIWCFWKKLSPASELMNNSLLRDSTKMQLVEIFWHQVASMNTCWLCLLSWICVGCQISHSRQKSWLHSIPLGKKLSLAQIRRLRRLTSSISCFELSTSFPWPLKNRNILEYESLS